MSDQFVYVGKEELDLITEVVKSQELWRGLADRMVAKFEDAFAAHNSRKYVHANSSGTCANEAAVAALGLEPGDEVIVTPCSFIASSIAPVGLGLVPVFADVDPRNFVLTGETIEAAITPRAKAVMVVHLWGQPADMGPILAVAKKHGLKVIEDCAQCYDGYWQGKITGSIGDVACWSLQQSKHLTSGEGGIMATDDPEMYKRMVLFSNCGMPWYRYGLEMDKAQPVGDLITRGHFGFGHNYRMSELQGAAALAQLGKIEYLKARRQQIADIIETTLQGTPGLLLARPYPDTVPNYWAYPVFVDPATGFKAADVCKWVSEAGAGVGRYAEINYLEAVYQQMEARRQTSVGVALPDYVHYKQGVAPMAEEAATRLLMFGVMPWNDDEGLKRNCEVLRQVMEEKAG
ncbi:MAG: DegT/DnrJ/EryC1/StrS family aminotransferase [Armatimonadia bacterium]